VTKPSYISYCSIFFITPSKPINASSQVYLKLLAKSGPGVLSHVTKKTIIISFMQGNNL